MDILTPPERLKGGHFCLTFWVYCWVPPIKMGEKDNINNPETFTMTGINKPEFGLLCLGTYSQG